METFDGKPQIHGYAAVFNSRSQILYTPKGSPFVEIIRPGAFARSLGEADVRCLLNHDPNQLLGRRGAGTLNLIEDTRGLLYTNDPPNNSVGRDATEWLQRGDITGSSFSFAAVDEDWSLGDDGLAVRELREVHLFDVGPVAFPAYLEASAAYRSYERKFHPAPVQTFPTDEQRNLLLRLRLAELR
jgi:HK97 family phage prohead protease